MAQVSVDTASHVITQIQSSYADKKDSQCLPSLLGNTIQNLKDYKLEIKEVLADGNYSSGEALRALEQYSITGYIPNYGHYKTEREGFCYDEQNDCFICAAGMPLEFKALKENHNTGSMMKQYRSNAKSCTGCSLKEKCIGKGLFKTIAVTTDKELFDKMHQRMKTPVGKICGN